MWMCGKRWPQQGEPFSRTRIRATRVGTRMRTMTVGTGFWCKRQRICPSRAKVSPKQMPPFSQPLCFTMLELYHRMSQGSSLGAHTCICHTALNAAVQASWPVGAERSRATASSPILPIPLSSPIPFCCVFALQRLRETSLLLPFGLYWFRVAFRAVYLGAP